MLSSRTATEMKCKIQHTAEQSGENCNKQPELEIRRLTGLLSVHFDPACICTKCNACDGEDQGGSGLAIAVGALLDGVPESIAIGLSILHGGAVSVATVAAIFLSNLPEGLSSSAGMRRSGRSATYVFGVWLVIAIACGLSSLVGYTVFDSFSPFVVGATTAVAAGAMLTMIVDTMIPEAFAETHNWAGLIAVLEGAAAMQMVPEQELAIAENDVERHEGAAVPISRFADVEHRLFG